MIVFLLLVIIAILLFGAGAVRGAIGSILAGAALLIGLMYLIVAAQQIPAWVWWTIGIVIVGGVGAIYALDARTQAKLKRDIADINRRGEIELAQIAERHARDMERLGRSNIKFHNDGLNAKKRKALRRQAETRIIDAPK